MRKFLLLTALALFSLTTFSQEKDVYPQISGLSLEARADFDYYNTGDVNVSGFSGKYLNFNISGNITEDLFYAYRQRLNLKGLNTASDFFDKTDFIYLGWQVTNNFALSAGKQVIAMGGIEYDFAPIDVYFHSEFWNTVACYQFGVNAIFTTDDEKNTFTAQITNSPFGGSHISGLYNYSIHWRANYKHFAPVCSVNLYEYSNGKFLNVIALGTEIRFGNFFGHLDYTNRASAQQDNFLFDDITVDGRLGFNFMNNKLSVYVSAGHDVNKAQASTVSYDEAYDHFILPGTDVRFYGGGMEFFPLNDSKDLRLHLFFAANDTKYLPGITPIVDQITYQANIGLTWRINFIKL